MVEQYASTIIQRNYYPQAQVTRADFGYPFKPFGFPVPQLQF
jgi:hypothetical protein